MDTTDWWKYRDDAEWSLWEYEPSRGPVDRSLAIGRRNSPDPLGFSKQGHWYVLDFSRLGSATRNERSTWTQLPGVDNFDEAAAMAITLWGMEA